MTFGKGLILYNYLAFHLYPESLIVELFVIPHLFENDSYIDISTYIP